MFTNVTTAPNVDRYLESHQLILRFQKTVAKLKSGNHSGLDLKKRKPKSSGIWSFRITKKYRAWAIRDQDTLHVFRIDDHQ